MGMGWVAHEVTGGFGQVEVGMAVYEKPTATTDIRWGQTVEKS